jgi:hypothetical protein
MPDWQFGPISGTSSGPSVQLGPDGSAGPGAVIEADPQAEPDLEIEIG